MKKLGLSIIISFFFVQLYTVVHAAEHVFEDDHDSAICDVCSYMLEAKSPNTNGDIIKIKAPALATVFNILYLDNYLPTKQRSRQKTRAPPSIA